MTIVDIARAAEVSRSTVYEYFRDKAAIVEACASLFSTPPSTLDMDDPKAVMEFVRAHVVRGFTEERSRPRRSSR
ncbi:hypothetical protein AWC32_20190 [Mycobacterium xenopi]|uniref:HTH tetR-type domain-containing protein n=2 Tax=Mycobacterium xenopi TaxID=1789 RepID=A0AAD1GYY2_MYCXE|nr:bacterial regulatory s, tetR family protein [Mycobacterium xenopi 3993]EUA73271.1 bacterial regulatory s, tetR family protein [Mycobacterium xenopi 4042]ORX22065.1 hypothetical protein AWC32_20190 [Mycobacterium xenopi]BBU21717.1 hypothetical protein MYXE_15060 [Mycobacterium xenopi]SPX93507.1 TetR family transcriptional regulator [Mycobacterium xenopi]